MNAAEIATRCQKAKRNGNGWTACCPAHDDRNPSLSITDSTDGRTLIKCHAGCTPEAVCHALQIETRDLFHDHPEAHRPALSAVYDYRNAEGGLVFQVCRFTPKAFRQRRPDPSAPGKWIWNLQGVSRVLYRLPEVLEAVRNGRVVFIVEGEKDVEAMQSLGLVATCNAGGAGKWDSAYSETLRGAKAVILPDRDKPGRDHAALVFRALEGKAEFLRVVELPDRAGRTVKDAADWITAGGTADELREIVKNAPREWKPPETPEAAPEIEITAAPVEPPAASFTPFPSAALPEPLRALVERGAAAIGCDASLVALPALAACAGAIGNARTIQLKKGWNEPCILWAVGVAVSGDRKSPAFDLALDGLNEIEERLYDEHRQAVAEYEEKRAECKQSGNEGKEPQPPTAHRFIIRDATIEKVGALLSENPRGLILARDELAAWFGSFDKRTGGKGDEAPQWLEMYRAGKVTIDRKTTEPRNIHVPRAALSICGTIQPGTLRRVLTAKHLESGMAARFVMAWPPPSPHDWTEDEIDDRTREAARALFVMLGNVSSDWTPEGKPRPLALPLDPEAKRLWVAFYERHGAEMKNAASEHLRAAFSKLEGTCARLAFLIQSIQNPERDTIGPDAMQRGITLADWFKGEARRIYSLLEESPTEGDARRALEWLESREGPATMRDALRAGLLGKDEARITAAFDLLEKRGAVEWMPSPHSTKGGRHTRRITLRAAAFTLPDTRQPDETPIPREQPDETPAGKAQ